MPRELRPRQTSFAAGELDPHLHRRDDFSKYTSGCKTAKNFFVSPHGSLMNRPGLEHVQHLGPRIFFPSVSDQTGVVHSFIATDDSRWILAFVHYQVWAFRFEDPDMVLHQKVTTPWTNSELPDLRFSQLGDVLRITHEDHAPRLLTLSGDWDTHDWEISTVSFEIEPFPQWNGTPYVKWPLPAAGGTAAPWRWAVTRIMERPDGSVYETAAHEIFAVRLPRISEWRASKTFTAFNSSTEDNSCFKAGDFSYWYASRWSDNTGHEPVTGTTDYWWEAFSTATFNPYVTFVSISDESPKTTFDFDADNPITIYWMRYDVSPGAEEDRAITTRVYRGQAGRFGYVGETTDPYEYVDLGETPDWTRQPPTGDDPFAIWSVDADGDHYISGYDYPRVSEYFEGRMLYAGAELKPADIWGSAIQDFNNFDEQIPTLDNNAYNFALGSKHLEVIRALIPRQQLIVLGRFTEWVVGGSGQAELITPNSVAARPLSKWGCADLPPLDVNDALFFMEAKGVLPRVMLFGPEGRVEGVRDVSTLSHHLFTGKTVTSWAYAEDPWSLLWVARDDGVVLSCAWNPSHEMVAWTRHEFSGVDKVLSICTLPCGTEDVVYMLTKRDGFDNPHLERLGSRVIDTDDVHGSIFLDGAAVRTGENTDWKMFVCAQLGPSNDIEVNDPIIGCISSDYGDVPGNAAADWVGKTIRRVRDDGVPFDFKLESLFGSFGDYYAYIGTSLGHYSSEEQTYYNQNIGLGFVDGDATDTELKQWAELGDDMSGLHHLDGLSVYALLDGAVAGPFTVEGARVEFGTRAVTAVVGLPYNCDFESLSIPQERGRQTNVKAVTLEVAESVIGGSIGESLDDLTEVPSRRVADNYGMPAVDSGALRTLVSGCWAQDGLIAFRQSDPLPVTIVGIMREVEVGG